MAFVNEYVSEDDVKKYKLADMWLRHMPEFRNEGVPSFYKFQWTIDRYINVYYMALSSRGGEENFTDSVLYLDGDEVDVRLQLADSTSKNLDDSPFHIGWNFLGFTPENASHTDVSHILRVLKEALICYGYSGVRKQITDTVVTFNF
ncbi:MAG TPA: hypothetical protein VK974_07405 [Methylophilaceae bacterium]|nr:hypothetical protein [Methylophilaceae bacterium]